MRKLMGIGAWVGMALLVTGCGDQSKSKMTDSAKKVTSTANTELNKAGKEAQETGASAAKAVQDAGTGASKTVDAAGKAAADAQAKISEVAIKASEALGEQFTKASEQATKTLQSVKGGPELVQKLSDIIPSLQKTLAGISDKASAENALPKLDEFEGTVSKLSAQFNQLPEEARKTVGDLVQKGAGSLQPLVDRVLALPGIETIRPKLEAIMTRLKSLKG